MKPIIIQLQRRTHVPQNSSFILTAKEIAAATVYFAAMAIMLVFGLAL